VRDLKKDKNMGWGEKALLATIGFTALISIYFITDVIIWNHFSPHTIRIANTNIKTMKDSGLLKKINFESKEVFVNRLVWESLNYELKKDAENTLLNYLKIKTCQPIYRLEIKDFISGQKLTDITPVL
jgi:hypothetical protein